MQRKLTTSLKRKTLQLNRQKQKPEIFFGLLFLIVKTVKYQTASQFRFKPGNLWRHY